MKQSTSLFRNIYVIILSLSLMLPSCRKDKDMAIPASVLAGQYEVIDDTETYILKVEQKGGNNFQINQFGGFLNVPLKAVGEGNTLKIPSQTFTNPNGSKITIAGTGTLSTKNTQDDTITFQYSLTGFGGHEGNIQGTRK